MFALQNFKNSSISHAFNQNHSQPHRTRTTRNCQCSFWKFPLTDIFSVQLKPVACKGNQWTQARENRWRLFLMHKWEVETFPCSLCIEGKFGPLPLCIFTKPSLSCSPIQFPSHPDSHCCNALSSGFPLALQTLSGNTGIKATFSSRALALVFPPLLSLLAQI